MGLTLSRKIGETIQLDITPGTTPTELWEAMQGGISIHVTNLHYNRAEINIDAPLELEIYRQEKRTQTSTS